ncbi:hypothetical protein [Robbsia andropogonis]|uniref:hypothetical protein n=1 Tax=Robbsia andropogonis TaxID=28092 RepID=UPI0004679A82|nr:hypothetical protein [Robbsia andropogonis]
MRKALLLATLVCTFSGCAIEGVGFDGRVNAYENAVRDGNEYVGLHPGTRDTAWYDGWCAAELPHFQRMSDQYARMTRYCDAMKAQPEHAAEIRTSLINDLQNANAQAHQRRDSVLAAVGAMAAAQPAPRPGPVTCTSTSIGTSTTTSCY